MNSKKSNKPKEMELVGGGLSQEQLKRIYGSRCVCSVGSADFKSAGACQCSYGPANGWANYNLAHEPQQ